MESYFLQPFGSGAAKKIFSQRMSERMNELITTGFVEHNPLLLPGLLKNVSAMVFNCPHWS